jgi:hypothetical protein
MQGATASIAALLLSLQWVDAEQGSGQSTHMAGANFGSALAPGTGHWRTTQDRAEHGTEVADVATVDFAAARRLLKMALTADASSHLALEISKELARSPGWKSVTAPTDTDATLLVICEAFMSPLSKLFQMLQPPYTSTGLTLCTSIS